MTQNSGSPGSDEINVFVVIDIPCVGALDTVENNGVSADGFEGTDWTRYTSGHQLQMDMESSEYLWYNMKNNNYELVLMDSGHNDTT